VEKNMPNNEKLLKQDKPKKVDTPVDGSFYGSMQVRHKRFNIPIWAKAWISLLPGLIFLLIFMIYPIINTFVISFIENFFWQRGAGSFAISNYLIQLSNANNPDLLTDVTAPVFSFNNFVKVMSDQVFLKALLNTSIIVIVSVPLTIAISLLIAVSLNSIKKLYGLYQTIFFLPYVTNAIALGMVFNVMFSGSQGGLMNQFLSIFGVEPINWLKAAVEAGEGGAATQFSMGVVIIAYAIWNGLAFKILVFMAGLANIDKQYYDAARIDGTKRSRIFWKITVPLLSPQILYITITSFIGAFKAYTSIISIFGQGPFYFGGDGDAWISIVGYIYYFQGQTMRLPYAAAGSVILLVIVLIITAIQFQVGKKRVHY
jgi:multiple sugar transport system permease protein